MADREVSLPFRIDARGRVAMTADPVEQGRQHLTSFLLTEVGERIMRPRFGSPIRESVFETLDAVTAHLLLTRTQDAVLSSVQGVTVRQLQSEADSDQAALKLTVEFALAVGAGEGVTRSTTIQLGGDTQ